MVRRLFLLCLCVYACAAPNTSCEPYPSPLFRGVAMQCSGNRVDRVPRLLPGSLQLLLLSGTAITSLDNTSFWGRALPQLTTLHVTGGELARVGAHALCALTALTMVYLNHNQLESLHDLSFSCNEFLRTVSVAGNPRLHSFPRMVSSSVENLYLDNCSLQSVDVAAVEGMTALKVLSVRGNPDLHCPSVESQFKQARPDLLVMCEDPDVGLPSSTFPDNQERASEKSLSESGSAVKNTKKYITDDAERTSDKSHNESGSAIKNEEKDITSHGESRVSPLVAAIACICIIIVIAVVVFILKSPSCNRYQQLSKVDQQRTS